MTKEESEPQSVSTAKGTSSRKSSWMRFDIDGGDIILIILVATFAWTWIRGDLDCSELCKKLGLYGEQRVTCICRQPAGK